MNKLFKAILVILTVGAVAVVSCYFAIPSFKQTINEKVFKIEQAVEQPKEEDNKSEAEYIIENETLKAENEALKTELGNIKTELEAKALEIATLTTKTQEDKLTIDSLKSNIATHEKALLKALEEKSNLEADILALEQNCKNLEARIEILNNDANSDAEEISNLEAELLLKNTELETAKNNLANKTLEVETLTTNIASITAERDLLLETVSNQETQIVNLQNSIKYYEDYLKALETEEKVFATFEINGEVVYIQELSKGSYASHETPVFEGYRFNGWTVNGSIIELGSYPVEENTTFVASFTRIHTVTFISEGKTISTQQVLDGANVQAVEVESTDFKVFNGWTVDGVVVDALTYTITQDTTFVASITNYYTVTFVLENEVVSTQKIEENAKAQTVEVESTDFKVFNGWTVDGVVVDVSTYVITQNTSFVADITYNYKTVNFYVDDALYSEQSVPMSTYTTMPEEPEKSGYDFYGWSTDGLTVIDVASIVVQEDLTFNALFTRTGGLYTSDGSKLVTCWDDLITQGYFTVSDNNYLVKTDTTATLSGMLVIDKGVTAINASCFNGCTDLTDIILPISVKYLGKQCFNGCTGLTRLDVPNSVTSIGSRPFMGCTNLTDLTMSANLTDYQTTDFRDLTKLNLLAYKGLLYLGNETNPYSFVMGYDELSAFSEITVHPEAKAIMYNALSNSVAKETVTYFNFANLTEIGDTLSGYSLLEEAVYSTNMTNIEKYLFENCSSLKTFNIPSNVKTIGDYAFRNSGLEIIIIPDSVYSLGSYTFANCTNLTTVKLGSNSAVFKNTSTKTFSGCTSLKTIYLPSTITEFKYGGSSSPFYGCDSSLIIYLEASEIPEGYHEKFNYYSSDGALTVKCGYTYEQYIAEIGA